MSTDIHERARFDFVRYANLWEDADILCEALQPRPGSHILSIASAGDNCFALLAEGATVVAADLSRAQLAATELKMAAIKEWDGDALLGFLGIRALPAESRRGMYRRCRAALSTEAQTFWDSEEDAIAEGFIHQGKFERYFHTFRTRVLPLIHSKKKVAALFEEKPAHARRDFYDRQWDTFRWRLLFAVFFSRFVLGRLGRDPEFFRYVEGSVADRLRLRTEYAFTTLNPAENPFLCYILRGNYFPAFDDGDPAVRQRHLEALPRYLRPEVLPRVREGLDRLTLYHGPIEEAAGSAAAPFDGYNLSDLFEYLHPDVAANVYEALLAHARPGARFAYWNMLVPRSCPERLRTRVRTLDTRARELFARDKAFFYSAFIIDEVL